jgi:CATRA-Associated Small Protein
VNEPLRTGNPVHELRETGQRQGVEELCSDVTEVLSGLVAWHVSAANWQLIDVALTRLDSALASQDAHEIADVLGILELLGPMRVTTRIDDTVAEPTPPPVQERVNELIHHLTLDDVAQQTGPDDRCADR